jgi:hypothetical protein
MNLISFIGFARRTELDNLRGAAIPEPAAWPRSLMPQGDERFQKLMERAKYECEHFEV